MPFLVSVSNPCVLQLCAWCKCAMNIHEHRFNGQRDCCRTVILQFCGAAAAMQTHMRDTHVRIPSIYTHTHTHAYAHCMFWWVVIWGCALCCEGYFLQLCAGPKCACLGRWQTLDFAIRFSGRSLRAPFCKYVRCIFFLLDHCMYVPYTYIV